MKAIVIKAYGGPEGLAVVELPAPEPAPGQVLISTEAAGVGGVDTMIRSGALADYGFAERHVPGGEVAGVVTAVGEGVEMSWIGQRVWAPTGNGGGYAEQAVAPAQEIVALPAELSAVDAVTLGSAGAVAHFGLAHARFAPGETVLVRGAAGSLGIMTVQLAARDGAAAVAVTTSSPARGERLRRLGATHVLDRLGMGTADDTPSAYDVIIDVAAGENMPAFFDRLNPGGRLVAVGAVAGRPPATFGAGLMAAFQKSLTFSTFSAATVPPEELRAVRGEHFAAAGRGDLKAVVHDVLPLDRAALAHHEMDAGEVFGRIVLTP
ncbi:oxidoreductase [Streptomyces camponoticapitis]|uniref:Oxidoreductase n=1 Tax=Streptomyces camponoticapitis TaxID=1616125 RepID=A0ABQ2DYT1_9ACTN|nr:zinc-binding dehydrogenase [Streptomyces camponoticapitis]GGJ79185.1 oxidoreductase [Streptomyces camponoticapitis]